MKTFLFHSGLIVLLAGIISPIIYLALRLPNTLDLHRFDVVIKALWLLGVGIILGILLLFISIFAAD